MVVCVFKCSTTSVSKQVNGRSEADRSLHMMKQGVEDAVVLNTLA